MLFRSCTGASAPPLLPPRTSPCTGASAPTLLPPARHPAQGPRPHPSPSNCSHPPWLFTSGAPSGSLRLVQVRACAVSACRPPAPGVHSSACRPLWVVPAVTHPLPRGYPAWQASAPQPRGALSPTGQACTLLDAGPQGGQWVVDERTRVSKPLSPWLAVPDPEALGGGAFLLAGGLLVPDLCPSLEQGNRCIHTACHVSFSVFP